MHSQHGLLSVWTYRLNQPYSNIAEVVTMDTVVIQGLPIDRDHKEQRLRELIIN